jgi:hypothetical protein
MLFSISAFFPQIIWRVQLCYCLWLIKHLFSFKIIEAVSHFILVHASNKCARNLIFNRDFQTALLTSGIGDNSGSLLSYDPSNNQTTVLLRNLKFASGVAVSGDGSFVLVSEYFANTIRRVWLKGPKANSSDLFMLLAGRPDNIKRNSRGQFWIAVNSLTLSSGVRVTENGIVLQIVSLVEEYGLLEPASEVQEYNGTLYGGSLLASYAIIFTP